jgi:hypothetical protein
MSRTVREHATVSSPSASKSKSAATPTASTTTARTGSKTIPTNKQVGKSPARATARVGATEAPKAGAAPVTKRARGIGAPAPAATAKGKPSVKSAPKQAEPRIVAKSTASAAAATRAAKAPPKPVPLAERPIDQVWR